jgi:hypothetical protein
MSHKYKLWCKTPQQIDENIVLPIGIYDVIEDNASYDRKPYAAKIKVGELEHWVNFDTFGICDSVERLDNGVFAMEEWFELSVINFVHMDEEEKRQHLDGLHPYYLSVDEYINGCDRDEYEHSGYKSLDDALLAATIADNSAHFTTQKRMNEILINSLKNR